MFRLIGEMISLRITITNDGPGSTKASRWYDRIILHDYVTLGKLKFSYQLIVTKLLDHNVLYPMAQFLSDPIYTVKS